MEMIQVGEHMWLTPEQDKLSEALLAFSHTFKDPRKDADNPHFRSKFVPLGGAIEAIRPAMREHGLFISQPPGGGGVYTIIRHESGQMQITWSHVPLDKQTPQGMGSALTYSRRYAMMGAAGAEGDVDDDAEAAEAPHRAAYGIGHAAKPDAPKVSKPTKSESESLIDGFSKRLGECQSVAELEQIGAQLASANLTSEQKEMMRALYAMTKDRVG